MWIVETIADRKFKVVLKNKYFLEENISRQVMHTENDVSDTFMILKDQMKKKTKVKK